MTWSLVLLAALIATAAIYPRALLWTLVLAGLGWFAALFAALYFVLGWAISAWIFVASLAVATAQRVRQLVRRFA